jgi:hypothetical protein
LNLFFDKSVFVLEESFVINNVDQLAPQDDNSWLRPRRFELVAAGSSPPFPKHNRFKEFLKYY